MKKFVSVLLALCMILSLAPAAFAASVRGDVDGDGKVTSSDALLVLQYTVGQKKTIDKTKADLNGDGQINSGDALIILQICVGMIFTAPTTTADIVKTYNSALKDAYYKENLTIDYTQYDKGKIENLTKKTSENFNDDYSRKRVFKNGKTSPGNVSVEILAPGCNIDVKGVASAKCSQISDGYKLVITLKSETTDVFEYPVYNREAFEFIYGSGAEMDVKSGTSKYTGTVFTLTLDKNGKAKSIEMSMPYVVDYIAVINGKTCTMRDTGEGYFNGKLIY